MLAVGADVEEEEGEEADEPCEVTTGGLLLAEATAAAATEVNTELFRKSGTDEL